MSRRGVTLVEVLVTTGLFALFMTVATSLLITTLKFYNDGESPSRLKEQARLLMYRMSHNIRNVEEIIKPTYLDLMGEDSSSVVLRVFSAEGSRVVGYRKTKEGGEGCIEEMIFDKGYDPDVLSTQKPISTRVVCRQVNQFSVGIEDSTDPTLLSRTPTLFTIRLEVQVSKTPLNLQTRINIRNNL